MVWADTEKNIEIELEGINKDWSETLLNGLSISRQKNSPRLNSRSIKRLHDQAVDELKHMLTVYGYYSPKITAELTEPEENNWQARYLVELGEPVTIQNMEIALEGEALNDPVFSKLVETIPLKSGDRFEHQRYENVKKSFLRIAAERGYFDGEFTCSKVSVNIEKNTADICLKYDAKQRYRFGDISFPDTVVNKELLDAMSPIEAGQPFNANELLTLRNTLQNSGYFASVSTQAMTAARDNVSVPIEVSLTENLKHRYSAGIGYGTDTGARMSLGWQNRYVNDRGHNLSVDSRLSQSASRVGADYKMPFWSENIDTVGFNTEYKQEDTDTSESSSIAVGSYYNRMRWGWEETGSIKFLNESFDVSDDSASTSLLIPGIAYARTWADDTLYTRHGGRVSLELSGAAEGILSDISFSQVVVRGKYIQGFGESNRIITRAVVGATEVSDFSKLPSSLRFFAGGDNSIRGFDYESLGPENDLNEVIGGRYLAVGSVEYEHMFVQNWGAAVFTDFGNAFNSWSDPIEYSVGIGIRWRSPVGLIRVDVASGISDEDKPFGLHIVIGPDL
ncbi:autotransporter assembly complex protein TamA [Methylophaga pinxianii]|uniref:autotransporter assembly complex protein TamA n=1 Tax=Methylophaga pinxianii TaxID=2881052 RepID=UPI001CF286A3|nr:autotransporter assembly complex family protein [Methylophaga pinxianii]MCB2427875.1 autotransporter assembly complex protein TamA [Methylophaga pinxianii]UPH44665.1 autotransporter assembly complex protein TamA [Methylophaga pinxianii]